ncbi:hypothetical protein CAOG_009583 [Capsaspora owczarzaki ATCC 30864]|uniref:Uncharacterized protein n=1 Tax=Capsaspora owczarzaki (strain ATCC 30864) TaxID=595528 RepID=A0A0D2X200_CAPO3|nr:hypothetical protein CAOG_009583 [Capsaspora owczarzaki ATCC 30864]
MAGNRRFAAGNLETSHIWSRAHPICQPTAAWLVIARLVLVEERDVAQMTLASGAKLFPSVSGWEPNRSVIWMEGLAVERPGNETRLAGVTPPETAG